MISKPLMREQGRRMAVKWAGGGDPQPLRDLMPRPVKRSEEPDRAAVCAVGNGCGAACKGTAHSTLGNEWVWVGQSLGCYSKRSTAGGHDFILESLFIFR